MVALVFLVAALADQVAAYVGDDVILESTVEENISFIQASPVTQQMFADTLGVRDYVLDELIAQKLVLAEAERESVFVEPGEIEAAVAWQVERVKEQYPSETDFLEDLQRHGLSLDDLMENYQRTAQKQLIMEKFIQQRFAEIVVSPIAVKKFYDENKDSIAIRPSRVHLQHMFLFIKPSETEQQAAFNRAVEVYKVLVTGGDFGVTASEFSEDENTKYKGGMLGRINRGEGLEELEPALFGLKPGEISQPLPTRLGYHIVEVLNRGTDWVLARHILLKVRVTESDTLRYERLTNTIRELVNSGADFDSLAALYSDESNTDAGEWLVDQLAPPYNDMVRDLGEGQMSEALLTPMGYHMLYVKEKMAEDTIPFEDLREQISNYLRQQKLQERYDQLVEELREKTFVKTFPKTE
jgi:peptidyl-prolyl cis-trans isomerase SurA